MTWAYRTRNCVTGAVTMGSARAQIRSVIPASLRLSEHIRLPLEGSLKHAASVPDSSLRPSRKVLTASLRRTRQTVADYGIVVMIHPLQPCLTREQITLREVSMTVAVSTLLGRPLGTS